MSRKDGNKMFVQQLSSVLPDDRPITAINIIEDIDKCPPNFTVISKTYDLDSDADLWRESGLFIKKKSRYICFSKTEGSPHKVIENISVIDEKDLPNQGFSLITHTVDSLQKAWRKRQLSYKVKDRDLCDTAVSDIIICSKIGKGSKIAPDEFIYAGVINGVYICYKLVNITNTSNTQPYANIELFQTSSPTLSNGSPHRIAPERPPKPKSKFASKPINGIYPAINGSNILNDDADNQDYEILSPNARIKPTRPAPRAPLNNKSSLVNPVQSYGTLPGSTDLDGVPFVLNPKLSTNTSNPINTLPVIKIRYLSDLDKEYLYDFRTERAT